MGRSSCRQLLLTLSKHCCFFLDLRSQVDSFNQPRSFSHESQTPTPYLDLMYPFCSLIRVPSTPSLLLSLFTFTFTFTSSSRSRHFRRQSRQTDTSSRLRVRHACYGARPKPRLKVFLLTHYPPPPSSTSVLALHANIVALQLGDSSPCPRLHSRNPTRILVILTPIKCQHPRSQIRPLRFALAVLADEALSLSVQRARPASPACLLHQGPQTFPQTLPLLPGFRA